MSVQVSVSVSIGMSVSVVSVGVSVNTAPLPSFCCVGAFRFALENDSNLFLGLLDAEAAPERSTWCT